MHSLRGSPLLFGYRGSAAVDVVALEDALMRVGYLADRLLWGEARVFTPVGMLLGFGLGMYLLYLRYVKRNDHSEH